MTNTLIKTRRSFRERFQFYLYTFVLMVGNTMAFASVTPSGQFAPSYKIELPAGAPGATPELEITYNSSANHDGPLGVGFSLSGLSEISRSVRAGLSYDDTDSFMLDGSLLIEGGSLTNINDNGSGYFYLEGSNHIYLERVQSGTDDYWIMYDAQGTKRYFGYHPSHASASGYTDGRKVELDSGETFSWPLTYVESAQGDYYGIYWESSVTPASNYGVSNYEGDVGLYSLSHISYATDPGHSNVSTAQVTVEFEYSSEAGNGADNELMYFPYQEVKTQNYLSAIKSYVNGNLFSRYDLDYDKGTSTRRIRLDSITRKDASGNSLNPTTFTWTDDEYDTSSGEESKDSRNDRVDFTWHNDRQLDSDLAEIIASYGRVGDFNCDGLSDYIIPSAIENRTMQVLYAQPDAEHLRVNIDISDVPLEKDNGTDVGAIKLWQVTKYKEKFKSVTNIKPILHAYNQSVTVADFNNDGCSDFHISYSIENMLENTKDDDYTSYIFYGAPNEEGKFVVEADKESLNQHLYSADVMRWIPADIDNDGDVDLIGQPQGANRTQQGIDSLKHLGKIKDWITAPWDEYIWHNMAKDRINKAMDRSEWDEWFDNFKAADAAIDYNAIYVRENTGTGTGDRFDAHYTIELNNHDSISTDVATVTVGDFNGDALPEILVQRINMFAYNNTVAVYSNTGKSNNKITFNSYTDLTNKNSDMEWLGTQAFQLHVGDFNGDGLLDLASQWTNYIDPEDENYYLWTDGEGNYSNSSRNVCTQTQENAFNLVQATEDSIDVIIDWVFDDSDTNIDFNESVDYFKSNDTDTSNYRRSTGYSYDDWRIEHGIDPFLVYINTGNFVFETVDTNLNLQGGGLFLDSYDFGFCQVEFKEGHTIPDDVLYLADFNMDGKTDILTGNNDDRADHLDKARLYVATEMGQFSNELDPFDTENSNDYTNYNTWKKGVAPYTSTAFFGDFNGDGRLDYGNGDPDDAGYFLSNQQLPDKLIGISNGSGETITIDYDWQYSDSCAGKTRCNYYDTSYEVAGNLNGDDAITRFTSPIAYVDSITNDSGFGDSMTTNYSYNGAYYYSAVSPLLRKYMGFNTFSQQSADTEKVTSTYHIDDYFKIGMLQERSEMLGIKGYWNTTRFSYTIYGTGNIGQRYVSVLSQEEKEILNFQFGTGVMTTSTTYNSLFFPETVSTVFSTYNSSTPGSGFDHNFLSTTTWATHINQASGQFMARIASKETLDQNSSTSVFKKQWAFDDKGFGGGISSNGKLTSVRHYSDVANNDYFDESYQYNSHGLMEKYTDGLGNVTQFTYDDNYWFLVKQTTNPLNHSKSATYDLLMRQNSATDENGVVRSISFDNFNRPVEYYDPSDSHSYPSRKYSYTQRNGTTPASQTVQLLSSVTDSDEAIYHTSVVFSDGWGRTLLQKSGQASTADILNNKLNGLDNSTVADHAAFKGYQTVAMDYAYSTGSETSIIQTTEPFFSSSLAFESVDIANHPYTQVKKWTNTTGEWEETTLPTGRTTKVKANLGQKFYYTDTESSYIRAEVFDHFGNLRIAVDSGSLKNRYEYDNQGRMIKVVDFNDNEETFEYDNLNRKIRHATMDGITWLYTYNNMGRILTQEVENSPFDYVEYTYDALGRLSEVLDPEDEAPIQSYYYDQQKAGFYNIGKLTKVEYGYHSWDAFDYDKKGAPTHITRKISDKTFSLVRQYDEAGRVVATTYPDGSIARKSYDYYGNVAQVADMDSADTNIDFVYYNGIELDEHNRPVSKALNTSTHTVSMQWSPYNSAGYEAGALEEKRFSGFNFSGSSTYDYEKDGHLFMLNREVTGSNHYTFNTGHIYGYDGHGRVNSAVIDSDGIDKEGEYQYLGDADLTYEYDNLNNLTRKGNMTFDFTGEGPYQVTDAVSDEGYNSRFTYDNVGNMATETHYDELGNELYTVTNHWSLIGELKQRIIAPAVCEAITNETVAGNIALQGTATQSSTSHYTLLEQQTHAGYAIDGNDSSDPADMSYSQTEFNADEYAYWQIDLGAMAEITKLDLLPVDRHPINQESGYDSLQIMISDTPFDEASDAQSVSIAMSQASWDYYIDDSQGEIKEQVTIDVPKVMGRYVRFQQTEASHSVQFAELKIYGTFPTESVLLSSETITSNVAPAGTPSQSPAGSFEEVPMPATNAIDGNYSDDPWFYAMSMAVNNGDSNVRPYWEIDLGESKTIDQVLIYPVDFWGELEYPNGFEGVYIMVSDSPFSSSTASEDIAASISLANWVSQVEDKGTEILETVSVDVGGVSGRYIRIQHSKANYVLALAEVEIIATTEENHYITQVTDNFDNANTDFSDCPASYSMTAGYDANGIRTLRNENGVVTYYPFEDYEETWANGELLKASRFIYDDKERIAVNTASNDESYATSGIYYYWRDRSDSVIMLTNANEEIVFVNEYSPYGSLLTHLDSKIMNGAEHIVEDGYTGQIQDSSGLIYYNSRYYHPVLGRFISSDMLTPGGDMNRYAYAYNNPLLFNDPDGRHPAAFMITGGVLMVAGGTIYGLAESGVIKENQKYWKIAGATMFGVGGLMVGYGATTYLGASSYGILAKATYKAGIEALYGISQEAIGASIATALGGDALDGKHLWRSMLIAGSLSGGLKFAEEAYATYQLRQVEGLMDLSSTQLRNAKLMEKSFYNNAMSTDLATQKKAFLTEAFKQKMAAQRIAKNLDYYTAMHAGMNKSYLQAFDEGVEIGTAFKHGNTLRWAPYGTRSFITSFSGDIIKAAAYNANNGDGKDKDWGEVVGHAFLSSFIYAGGGTAVRGTLVKKVPQSMFRGSRSFKYGYEAASPTTKLIKGFESPWRKSGYKID